MKKVLDWTLGGIFRTIGRFIGFLLIGLLLSFIVFKSNLKITDLLGFDVVKADTLYSWTTQQARIHNSKIQI